MYWIDCLFFSSVPFFLHLLRIRLLTDRWNRLGLLQLCVFAMSDKNLKKLQRVQNQSARIIVRCVEVSAFLFHGNVITCIGCIEWNAHNTVFGSNCSTICAQAVYFLHSTMPSVTCLRLCDVSVICRVTYLQFTIRACFASISVRQAAQRRTWFAQ